MRDEELKEPFGDEPMDPLEDEEVVLDETYSPGHEQFIPKGGSGHFNYQCPESGGKFSSWDHDNPAVATSPEDTGEKRCPFCHVRAGDFGDHSDLRKENERLREELEEAERQIENLQDALKEIEAKFE